MLTFNDGLQFNTDGPLRKQQAHDGWYVIGRGMMLPVKDEAEANSLIEKISSGNKDNSKPNS